MLPRHLRLRRPQDFETVRREGSRWQGRGLTLNARPNNLPNSRYGFVVSGRVGKAVVRNQVKRRLREAIRQWLPALATGYDVVLIAHTPAAQASYQELESETGKLLRRAGILVAAEST
jgi:ribonuclease P protein component